MTRSLWDEASEALARSAPYRALAGGARDVVRLPLAAAAWVAELLAARQEGAKKGRPVLAVVPGEADVLTWLEAVELFAPDSEGEAVSFPAPSLSPYQRTEISLMVRAREATALDAVTTGRARTVVTTPRALFRRLPDRAAFQASILEVAAGEDFPIDLLAEHLVTYGYQRADLVAEIGDFAVRGGVFDLYPPGAEEPLRLDFFGDTVDSIRSFDPVSQRSSESLERARILPLSTFAAGPGQAERLADRLAEALDPSPGSDGAELLAELRGRGGFDGWEHYLPFLHGAEASLPELLGDPLIVVVDPATLAKEAAHHAEVLADDYAAHGRGPTGPSGALALPPEAMEHEAATVEAVLGAARVRVLDLVLGGSVRERPDVVDFEGTLTDLFQGQLPRFPREVETARARGERCVLVVNPAHQDRMEELLTGREVPVGPDGVRLVPGELSRGFRLPAARLAIYGEPQILPRRSPLARQRSKSKYGPFVSGLRDLKVGDYVVHTDHGIAQFVGLRSVGGDGGARDRLPPVLREGVPEEAPVEVMELIYSGDKRLLVPLDRMDLIQKYSGIEGLAPRLDKLGGTSWNKTKSRIKKSMRYMADELLKLYAQRQLARAEPMGPDTDRQHQFEAAFAYDESPDQLDAIAAIKEDLDKERPMDRLLCGDVGYGKTEVAMRAAFKAVDAGFQVAVLAPTTILADQHLETFRRRFSGFGVNIEMISRFRSHAEIREIRKKLEAEEIDILIGTHRLLSKDMGIPKLGLLIVDEEQRFGVVQKERLKKLKQDVHVLAMSATPIPRTLQLSLAGVRDMSLIETPPKDRMAIETAILPWNAELVREAIEYELERGGQVYYVYNRVESIEWMLGVLREIVPGVRITVGHGQMDEKELARRMHAFTDGEYDVLLATTIIENGIDIPNVNTMMIHRADRFGLSQLYQLRGRVGRSNQLAYCYLMVERDRVLSENARKRLAAIREFTDLGAGFRIAARDLEIRGAGNLLGAEQSGHIAALGLETYLKMLEETVKELSGEKMPEEGPSTAIDLPVPMSIPLSYISDDNLRMEIYRKVASGESAEEDLVAELTDRFGDPPPAVRALVQVGAVKRLAEGLRVQSISARKKELVIRMRRDAHVDVDRLIEMVSTREGASFSPSGVLTLPVDDEPFLAVARKTLDFLAAPPGDPSATGGEGSGRQAPGEVIH